VQQEWSAVKRLSTLNDTVDSPIYHVMTRIPLFYVALVRRLSSSRSFLVFRSSGFGAFAMLWSFRRFACPRVSFSFSSSCALGSPPLTAVCLPSLTTHRDVRLRYSYVPSGEVGSSFSFSSCCLFCSSTWLPPHNSRQSANDVAFSKLGVLRNS
jgi:hypothetical protein